MKKLFFFAAAMLAATTVSAAEVDYADMKSENEYEIAHATLNSSSSSETKRVYDLEAASADLTWYKIGAEFAEFHITNTSEAKKKIFTVNLNKSTETGKSSVEFGGKNGIIYLKGLQVGDVIEMVVANKSGQKNDGSWPDPGQISVVSHDKVTTIGTILSLPCKNPNDPEADGNGYVWKTFTETVTNEMFSTTDNLVYVKETVNGFRVKSIKAGAATAIFDVESGAKAVKVLDENGQIVILKGDRRYNALGAEL